MKIILVAMNQADIPSSIPSDNVLALIAVWLREDPKDKKRTVTWMDRTEAEKVVMRAWREGYRVLCLGRDVRNAFEFRNVGTIERNTTPKEGQWYEVPTSGSLPPLPIAWVEPRGLTEFFG